MATKPSLFKRIVKSLGPGFITGGADDDPSGIATYAQTGAQFGFTQLWVTLFSYPFMTAIQEMCGRIGMHTGKGIAGVLKKHYPSYFLFTAVSILLVANTVNIGADLGAMAAALELLLPVPFVPLLLLITVGVVLLQIYIPYALYAKFLKWSAFSLLAYIGVVFVIDLNWDHVLSAVVKPHFEWSTAYLLNVAALLGTIISPYLFFWQASEEVEEELVKGKLRTMGRGIPKVGNRDYAEMRLDTSMGMLFSNLIAFFVIVAAAGTLGMHGITQVETAADAAEALRPLAGDFAFLLFALGIVGVGLLAVPVLAGSAAYAVSEMFGWREGLGKKFHEAKGFYAVIAVATVIGLAVNFTSIPPMTMLYYTAILNGVLAPPLLILILLIANNKKIMGDRRNGVYSNLSGILITAFMTVVAFGVIASAVGVLDIGNIISYFI